MQVAVDEAAPLTLQHVSIGSGTDTLHNWTEISGDGSTVGFSTFDNEQKDSAGDMWLRDLAEPAAQHEASNAREPHLNSDGSSYTFQALQKRPYLEHEVTTFQHSVSIDGGPPQPLEESRPLPTFMATVADTGRVAVDYNHTNLYAWKDGQMSHNILYGFAASGFAHAAISAEGDHIAYLLGTGNGQAELRVLDLVEEDHHTALLFPPWPKRPSGV